LKNKKPVCTGFSNFPPIFKARLLLRKLLKKKVNTSTCLDLFRKKKPNLKNQEIKGFTINLLCFHEFSFLARIFKLSQRISEERNKNPETETKKPTVF